jgi:hypothetical protein
MTDFETQKVAFAIGMLAVLIAISPFVDELARYTIDLGGWDITGRSLYAVMASALAITVYAHAVQFVTHQRFRPLKHLADVAYGVAIFLPILCVMTFLFGAAAQSESSILGPDGKPIGTRVDFLMRWASILFLFLAASVTYRKLVWKRRDTLATLDRRQILCLDAARSLSSNGDSNDAVRRALEVIELASQRVAVANRMFGRTNGTWALRMSCKSSPDITARLERLRAIRKAMKSTANPETPYDVDSVIADAAHIVCHALRDNEPLKIGWRDELNYDPRSKD